MIIPYGKQEIEESDIKAVIDVLKSDFLTQGPKVKEFEDCFSSFVGSKYAVAVSNGTAALHLSCLAIGLQENQNIITTPITFAASANCIRYCSANVYFVDIDPNTGLMDLDLLEKKLENAPNGFFSGVVIVDFAGQSVDLNRLNKIKRKYGLWVIQDSCHALGGGYKTDNGLDRFGSSSNSDITVFSFHPVKHITTGEGGMITTNDINVYNKLIKLRTHGITRDSALYKYSGGAWYYEMQELGYNYRMSDIQAALGISQLLRIKTNVEKRNTIAKRYIQSFSEVSEIKCLQINDNIYHAYHLFVILVEKRVELYEYLKSKGVFAQVHYIPVHLMPYYRDLGFKENDFPNSENYYSKCLSLPMYHSLKEEEQLFVIDSVKDFFK